LSASSQHAGISITRWNAGSSPRQTDARAQLRLALDAFTDIGAQAFAERARAELAAAGQRVPRPPSGETPLLTAQETRVADLAVQGTTKAEMAAKLYISANTVDYHLRHVYQKLGVRSRRELARAYKNSPGSGLPAGAGR